MASLTLPRYIDVRNKNIEVLTVHGGPVAEAQSAFQEVVATRNVVVVYVVVVVAAISVVVVADVVAAISGVAVAVVVAAISVVVVVLGFLRLRSISPLTSSPCSTDGRY